MQRNVVFLQVIGDRYPERASGHFAIAGARIGRAVRALRESSEKAAGSGWLAAVLREEDRFERCFDKHHRRSCYAWTADFIMPTGEHRAIRQA